MVFRARPTARAMSEIFQPAALWSIIAARLASGIRLFLVPGGRPNFTPFAFAAAMPAIWRSLRTRFNFGLRLSTRYLPGYREMPRRFPLDISTNMLRMSSLFSSLSIVFTVHAWPTRASVSLPQRAHRRDRVAKDNRSLWRRRSNGVCRRPSFASERSLVAAAIE
jgi:hypothetical protein